MKMPYYYILATVIIIVVGFVIYSHTQKIEQPPAVQNAVITTTTKDSCEARGGEWKSWSDTLSGDPKCNLPTADGGKKCTDSSQCESYCQAPSGAEMGAKVTGECYKFKAATCMQEVKNGSTNVRWCE